MRHRRLTIVAVAAAALLFLVVRGFIAWQDTSDRTTSHDTPNALAARTVKGGAVTVKIEPERIDATGAEFRVSFDTHSVDLGFDVAANAQLTVAGTAWGSPSWRGDGPGGHHRSGTLQFTASSPPTGNAVLRLGALPSPVTASWTLPEA